MPIDTSTYNGGKSPELPNLKRPGNAAKPPTSRINDAQQTAQKAAETTKIALVSGHQERLVALSTALDKAEQRRTETLDLLSDRVAYLQDGDLFMHDLLRMAQKKLRGDNDQPGQQTTATALDALVDAFDEIGDWELPAIAPAASAGGALPAAY